MRRLFLTLFTVAYMAFTSRLSGRGTPRELPWLGEVLFALGIGAAVFTVFGGLLGALCAIWGYLWMQTGHANALPWGDGGHNPERRNTLSPVVHWICRKLDIPLYSKNFARVFMSVKGFLIGLPLGGIPLMILWPLGYEIGNRVGKHWISEVAAGAGAGIAILIFLGVT